MSMDTVMKATPRRVRETHQSSWQARNWRASRTLRGVAVMTVSMVSIMTEG